MLTEYKTKLCIDGESIQDLFDVKSGWTGEKASLTKWPSVYIMDISEYLNRKNPQDLMKRLLNEYKEGKAYRYFSGKWVKEIYYHYISEKSDKCMLKAKVTPSQAVNNKPYDCWIIIKKDVGDIPGGQIMSAYCTCTAGMLGSCNHIAGVLLRIEHAVKMGMTKPTSTGKLCEWTVPARKTKVNLKKISDFVWKKSCYSKMLTDVNQENEISAKKRNFTPLTKTQETRLGDRSQIRVELHKLLKNDIPNSCFSSLMENKRIEGPEERSASVTVPETLSDIGCSIPKDGLTYEERKKMFISKIKITE